MQKARLAQLPQVPAMAELVPGFEYAVWFGISAPAKTTPALARQLEQAIQSMLKDPDFAKRLFEAGVQPAFADSDAVTARIAQELADMRDIGRRTALVLE